MILGSTCLEALGKYVGEIDPRRTEWLTIDALFYDIYIFICLSFVHIFKVSLYQIGWELWVKRWKMQ